MNVADIVGMIAVALAVVGVASGAVTSLRRLLREHGKGTSPDDGPPKGPQRARPASARPEAAEPVRRSATRIFICYRRADSEGAAGRIYDGLSSRFGAAQLFMDVDSVPFGHDFVDAMLDATSGADVVLAVIGRTWLTGDAGGRRIDDSHDPVRLELETALRLKKRVIPVLVGGGAMPSVNELPEGLAALARRHAITVHHATFQADLQRLVEAIEETRA